MPFRQDRIRFRLSEATDWRGLLNELVEELTLLTETPPNELETTLLIHPEVLTDFEEYLEFAERTREVLQALDLEGVIQIATFHPDYQFADTEPHDPTNNTNRSPYPMLHLIREASIEEALKTYPDPEKIPERNMEKMRELESLKRKK